MNTRHLYLVVAAALATQAQATLSGVAEGGAAFAYQADFAGGVLYNPYYSGASFAVTDPYTVNSFGLDTMSTQLSYSTSVTSSSSYLQMDGSFSGISKVHWGESQGSDNANAQGYDQVNFTTTTSAFVTLTAYNAASSTVGFTNGYSEVNFNGTYYQLTPGNFTSSFWVGPGSYYMWWGVSTSVYGGQYYGTDSFNSTSSDFRLTVSSVPEPTTIGLLAVGGVALLRRRRK